MKLGSATHNPSLLPNIHNYSRRRRCVCVWLDISLAPEMFHVTTLIHLTSGACGRNHWWFHFRIELLRWMNAIRICNNNNNQKKKKQQKIIKIIFVKCEQKTAVSDGSLPAIALGFYSSWGPMLTAIRATDEQEIRLCLKSIGPPWAAKKCAASRKHWRVSVAN